MAVAIRRSILEWEVNGRIFALVEPGSGDTAEFRTPDGQTLTLTLAEWRALAEVVGSLPGKPPSDKATRRKDLPARAGEPWDAAEDAELTNLWTDGAKVGPIAERLQRTRGAITSRLTRLKLITDANLLKDSQ